MLHYSPIKTIVSLFFPCQTMSHCSQRKSRGPTRQIMNWSLYTCTSILMIHIHLKLSFEMKRGLEMQKKTSNLLWSLVLI